MRCHYMSDLHLEAQDFRHALPEGDMLIVAGDLCHASALDPARTDPYRVRQRDRVRRFADAACSAFRHVLLVAGNHEYHDGLFEEAVPLLKRHLQNVTVLNNEAVDIDGARFFGTTLWSDFDGRSETSIAKSRRGVGEYFFTRTRRVGSDGGAVARLTPTDTLAAHEAALAAFRHEVTSKRQQPLVVITHHAPSRQGLNPAHIGNGLDGAFASDLDRTIAALEGVPFWIHGHTHIRKRYHIGETTILANCRGFEGKDLSARNFSPSAFFEL
ncbi:metallophosphoesterase [Hyphomicrobium sp.]|uniref:metallophosphoesterase n=1 Tax=Hyphomicrobium sp. TaxID=82 RepID=UPI0025B96E06|nr:metallophosphoesterase [Hyphomicrobium sp.]MCC7252391.1 metallophosphoesterase [Hyphomicrobium sp.]